MTSGEHNPWDQTIWDPINPEQAIEDPFHGPSAIEGMLATPAMPHGDGTYYQPGLYYTEGVSDIDSKGNPVLRVRLSLGFAGLREIRDLQEWTETWHESGDEGLEVLEAGRQQERMEITGFAHCYKPEDVCPGGKKLAECGVGGSAFEAGENWAQKQTEAKPNEGAHRTTLAYAGGSCEGCGLTCEASVKTVDGVPRETRVSFFRPNPDIPTIYLDLGSYASPVNLDILQSAQNALDKLKGEE